MLRSNAILVHGTSDMSTDDVFQYFVEYGPSHLEWINDISCTFVMIACLMEKIIIMNV